MFKFLVSVGDWAGKFGLPFFIIGRNYICPHQKKLCMSVSEEVCIRRNYACLHQEKLCMSVSDGIMYVCIRRSYVFLHRDRLAESHGSVSGGIPSPAKPPPAKLVFFPSPWLGVPQPYKSNPPAFQIDINQSYIIY